jgi:hypothetical protein
MYTPPAAVQDNLYGEGIIIAAIIPSIDLDVAFGLLPTGYIFIELCIPAVCTLIPSVCPIDRFVAICPRSQTFDEMANPLMLLTEETSPVLQLVI